MLSIWTNLKFCRTVKVTTNITRMFSFSHIFYLITDKFYQFNTLNPLPNNKFLDWYNLKELTDSKIKVTEKLKFVLEG